MALVTPIHTTLSCMQAMHSHAKRKPSPHTAVLQHTAATPVQTAGKAHHPVARTNTSNSNRQDYIGSASCCNTHRHCVFCSSCEQAWQHIVLSAQNLAVKVWELLAVRQRTDCTILCHNIGVVHDVAKWQRLHIRAGEGAPVGLTHSLH